LGQHTSDKRRIISDIIATTTTTTTITTIRPRPLTPLPLLLLFPLPSLLFSSPTYGSDRPLLIFLSVWLGWTFDDDITSTVKGDVIDRLTL